MKPRLLIHWQNLPGYIASSLACFRKRCDVETLLLYNETDHHAPFNRSDFPDVGVLRNVTDASPTDLGEIIDAFNPTVGLVSGWTPMSHLVATCLRESAVPVIAASDNIESTSWLRRRALPFYWRFALRPLFARYWVPGRRGEHYLRSAGVPGTSIRTGVYAVDADSFSAGPRLLAPASDGVLVYVGQYIERKGIPELLEGFEASGTNWELRLSGAGPLKGLIDEYAARLPNVREMGFTQPRELPRLLRESSAFIFPSREDHWGVAVLEAAIARLPIICTSVCGAAADLVRDGENGYCIPSRDPRSIAHAIRLLTTMPAETRRRWGERSHALALPYDVTAWSDTLFSLVKDLHGERMATRGREQ